MAQAKVPEWMLRESAHRARIDLLAEFDGTKRPYDDTHSDAIRCPFELAHPDPALGYVIEYLPGTGYKMQLRCSYCRLSFAVTPTVIARAVALKARA